MLNLRLVPLVFLVASLTACSSVQSAPQPETVPPAPVAPVETTPERMPMASISDTDLVDAPMPTTPAELNVTESATPNYKETFVTRKISQLRGDKDKIQSAYGDFNGRLKNLQERSETSSRDYYGAVAAINARLQVGTTPGNPILVDQTRMAQGKLESIAGDINVLTGMSNNISNSASAAAYLLESIRATYGLSGAIDEDHIALAQLEDEVNRLVVQIDRQMTEVNGDINRRTSYLASERRNLQTLTLAVSHGELYGESLANRAFFAPSNALPGDPDLAGSHNPPAGGFAASKPLVIIRFDRPDVKYEQALYVATSEALQRYPNVSFEVVAISPVGANPARSTLAGSDAQINAKGVVRSMSQLGIPGNRIKLSSSRNPALRNPEVQIFLR